MRRAAIDEATTTTLTSSAAMIESYRPPLPAWRSLTRRQRRYVSYANGVNKERVLTSLQLSEGSGVQEAIELTRTMKDLGGLKNAWEEYLSLREVRFARPKKKDKATDAM